MSAAEFQEFYDSFNVSGVFVLYDENNDQYLYHNQAAADSLYSPASTFKICNSLIGLETGAVSSEKEVFAWDGVERNVAKWNRNTDMELGFKNSTVWFYQEMATRIGMDTMQFYLNKLDYGNKNTGGGITRFWLIGGDLRITPNEQINFLRRLNHEELPVKQSTMQTVKRIMQYDVNQDYNMRGKTGWGGLDENDMGWFVGYVEANDNTYYFANLVIADGMENPDFSKSRVQIVYDVLRKLKVIS